MINYQRQMQAYLSMIEERLDAQFPTACEGQEIVCNAMRYSVENGGKRIRPLLTLAFCELCGADPARALPFACAVEMVHTYSLIHDDLPCMDDDDMRRGKPSCHIQFGEPYALLAGDGLLTLAFETALTHGEEAVGAKAACRAASILAKESGCMGMIGGQVIDLQSEGKRVDIDVLKTMDRLKTSALISAACQMGCAAADAPAEWLEAARRYAEYIGLAFQIVDDILDLTGDAATLGKPVGSDLENDKSTYVSLLGLSTCTGLVESLTQKAIKELDRCFGDNAGFLKNLAEELSHRQK